MNEFEQQVLASIHDIELKVTKEISELRGEISSLRDIVERNITIDTDRLNNHGKDIDEHSKQLAKFEEWKTQLEERQEEKDKQVSNRIAVSQSISTVAAVLIAFLLSKFL